MNTSHVMSTGLFLVTLLVASCWGAATNGNEINSTYSATTATTTSNIITNAPTTKLITTAPITTAQTTSNDSTVVTTAATSVIYTATTSNATTFPNTTTTTTTTTTTKSSTTPVKPTGRKFDGLSFVGGMILATGLSAIIYLVVSYLRRNNQLPYSNLS